MILGSVGTNTWRGSLQELHEQKETQIQDPLMKNDSYMGIKVIYIVSCYLLFYYQNLLFDLGS